MHALALNLCESNCENGMDGVNFSIIHDVEYESKFDKQRKAWCRRRMWVIRTLDESIYSYFETVPYVVHGQLAK